MGTTNSRPTDTHQAIPAKASIQQHKHSEEAVAKTQHLPIQYANFFM